jgi:hypothetical protein
MKLRTYATKIVKNFAIQGGFFPKNLRASLFNDDLSNEPNFGRIRLAGQYLKILCLFL